MQELATPGKSNFLKKSFIPKTGISGTKILVNQIRQNISFAYFLGGIVGSVGFGAIIPEQETTGKIRSNLLSYGLLLDCVLANL